MLSLARAVVVIALVIGAAAHPQSVSACSGGIASLANGVHHARAIYYARVLAVHETSLGFLDLRLDVQDVVRGTARAHVVRAIPNEACTGVRVGQHVVVVLGSIDPFRDGLGDPYNLIYVLGAGRTTRADAQAALGVLPPATDAAIPSADGQPLTTQILLLTAPIAFAFAVLYLGRRRRHRVTLRERQA